MHVLALCCTYNRFSCLQRSLRCFLDQDYEGEATLLIYNSGAPLELEDITLPSNRHIILINNDIDQVTGQPYSDVGSKYRDALNSAPEVDVVVSWDDDDIPLPNHMTEGVAGYLRAISQHKIAYKPFYSYYNHAGGTEKCHNVFEPSIFVNYFYLKNAGYALVTVRYHQQWLDPLTRDEKILVDPTGKSTWIYDWHPSLQVFKLSGGKDNQANFVAHQTHSKDTGMGDKLVPLSSNQQYYNLINVVSQ